MDLRNYVRDIPDFPVKGIIFRDITPLLKNPRAFQTAVDLLCDAVEKWDFDLIVSPESRGFIFGSTMAYKLGKGFIPVRKPGKLPYTTVSIEYELEYGKEKLEIHSDALDEMKRVVIVDDVMATGGTMNAIAKLVKKMGGNVVGIATLIELTYLKPREKLKDYEIVSLLKY